MHTMKDCSCLVLIVSLDAIAGVRAKVLRDDTVACHGRYPSVCVGDVVSSSPSPTERCPDESSDTNCTVTYAGGWMWTQRFVRGLDEGSSFLQLSPADRTAALTGGSVVITMEDDRSNCTVVADDRVCDECSVCVAADGAEDGNFSFSADCTNVPTGRRVDCEPVLPIFYPLDGTNDNDVTMDDSSSPLTPSPSILLRTIGVLAALLLY